MTNKIYTAQKMREALSDAYYAMFKFIKTPYAECVKWLSH